MFRYVIDNKELFFVYTVELPVNFNDHVVIDIETTGFNEHKDEIVSYGFVVHNKATVITRAYASHRMLLKLARIHARILKKMGYKLYAWYHEFEEKWLGVEFNELQIKPYEKKDRNLSWGINSPVDGSEVPELWRKWVRDRDVCALKKIALRNMYDLLIEAASLLRHNYLRLMSQFS